MDILDGKFESSESVCLGMHFNGRFKVVTIVYDCNRSMHGNERL